MTVVTDPATGFGRAGRVILALFWLPARSQQQLIDYGSRPSESGFGMPVHSKFDMPEEHTARADLSSLGWTPESHGVRKTPAGSARKHPQIVERWCGARWMCSMPLRKNEELRSS